MVAMVAMDLVCDLRSMNNGSIWCRSSIAVGGSRDFKVGANRSYDYSGSGNRW